MSQKTHIDIDRPTKLENTTIVIQGRTDPECIRHYANMYGPSCIISTWNDENVDSLGMKVVRSARPSDRGPQNSHLQIVSTLAGLRCCTTKWVIKVRGDEYFSNLEYVIDNLSKTSKILTLPIFFRPHKAYPFHPSDHLMAATKEQLLMMYRNALRRRALKGWKWAGVPEQLLGAAYLEEAEGTRRINKEHMLKHFDILDLEKVKDYRVTWNGAGKKFYNNFDPTMDSIPSIKNMNDL